jgi:mannosylfructose-phosphate synthase
MKILMISAHGYVEHETDCSKPDTGGQVVYVMQLAKQLAGRGHEVTVATRAFDGNTSIVEQDGVLVMPVHCSTTEFLDRTQTYVEMPEMADRLAQHPLPWDIIHSHYWDAGIAGTELAHTLLSKHVWTPHTLAADKRMTVTRETLPEAYESIHRAQEECRIAEEADAIISTNHNHGLFLRADDVCITPGYDDETFNLNAHCDGNTIIDILAAGRMDYAKGWSLLMEAMNIVWRYHKDLQLTLVASCNDIRTTENYRRSLLTYVDEKFRKNITFRDCVSQHELAKLMGNSELFVMPSRRESFGMVAAEAMGCGTAVLVSSESGISRYIDSGVNGFICDPSKAERFGYCIASIFDSDAHRWNVASSGSHLAYDNFRWEKVASSIEKVYHDVLG